MVYTRQLMQYAPYSGTLATAFASRGRTAQRAGGTNSYTTTRTKRRRPKGRQSIKKLMASVLPGKQNTNQLVSGVMKHSTLYTVNVTAMISQGNTNSTRIGDSIILNALKLNGAYFSHTTAGAYTFRILVGYSGEEYSNTTFGSGLGASEIFLPSTFGNFAGCGIVNPRAFSVVFDKKIDINSQIAGVVDLSSFTDTISLNGVNFDYQANGSAYGKVKNLYMVIVADVAGGTPATTDSGTMIVSTDLVFK